ncbi:MAG: hypothetical protein M3R17_10700 [Bacteroidota bacterium]|nr:hypothetical protein [Bacteroidota bacterium]
MKKIILFFALAVTSISLNAQNNVQYKILEDNPLRACNFAMGIDIAQLDFSVKNIDGLAFSAGIWGFADYKHLFGADYILRYGYFTMGKAFGDKENLKAHRQIEIGGYLNFKKGLFNKTNKVNLNIDRSTVNGKEVETTTYVMVPSTQYINSGVRAGFMNYGGCLSYDGPEDVFDSPEIVNYNVLGLYAGIFKEKTKSVLISTDTYGKRGVSLHTRVYLDALITPVSSISYRDIDYKPSFKSPPIGARLGMAWYPVLTRKETRGEFKARRFLFQTEVGYRRYDGLYFTGTISFPISKHISRLSDGSDKPTQTKETE